MIRIRSQAENRYSNDAVIPGSPGRRTPSFLSRRCAQCFLCLLVATLLWLVWQPTQPQESVWAGALLLTATPTLAPGMGGIAGQTWNDANGNTVHDMSELPLAGVRLTLYDQGGQPLLTTTTGIDGNYRFAPLSSGSYRLTVVPPTGYTMTTADSYNVFVSPGAILTLDFGAQFVPTLTPTATPIPKLDIDHATFAVCGSVIQADTRAGHNVVSRYGCQPAWEESGPELIYRIELGRSQPLSAALITVTADLDLFLVPSAYPETCIAAGDNYVSIDAQPGIYFLAVDGYEGAAGVFSMRLMCPLAPQATSTPTRTPSPTPTATATFTPGPTPSPTAPPELMPSYLPLVLRPGPVVTPEPVVLVLQQGVDGYIGTSDTTLSAWEPETALGDEDVLRLRYNRQTTITTHMAPLLRFDTVLLSSEANIVKATLRLYLETPPPLALRGELHGMARVWDAATATWLVASPGVAWAVQGAQGAGDDYLSWMADEQTIDPVGGWYEFDVTALVTLWVRDPGSNRGLIMLAKPGADDANVEAVFASSEHANPELRPELAVSYWISGEAAVARHSSLLQNFHNLEGSF